MQNGKARGSYDVTEPQGRQLMQYTKQCIATTIGIAHGMSETIP